MSLFPISLGIVIFIAATGIPGPGVEGATEALSSQKLRQVKVPTLVDKVSPSSSVSKSGVILNRDLRPRQYGWGWSASSGSGSYDIYTLVAVAAFAALFGALFFELATGGTLRSLGSSIPVPFGMDSDQVSELMSKVSNFVSDIDWMGVIGNATEFGITKSRAIRDVSEQTGVVRWVEAYKKDPIEYQCVRKLACETLADSTLIAKSMRSPFGGIVLSAVGMFIEHGEELQSIVQDTIGNPEKCNDIAPWGFCDDNQDELNSTEG